MLLYGKGLVVRRVVVLGSSVSLGVRSSEVRSRRPEVDRSSGNR